MDLHGTFEGMLCPLSVEVVMQRQNLSQIKDLNIICFSKTKLKWFGAIFIHAIMK